MRRFFPVVMGVVGVALLCGLGTWQLQRMTWKRGILDAIDAQIVAAPVALPAAPDAVDDRWLPVTVHGALTGDEVHVLTSIPEEGPGYRIISKLVTDDNRIIMVDLGFVPQDQKNVGRAAADLTIVGNLLWPQEADSWTPPPDPANIWFARDVVPMAVALGSEEVLVVARRIEGAAPHTILLPVDSAAVANDHLNYAITWFSLAAIWAVMSGALIARQRRAA